MNRLNRLFEVIESLSPEKKRAKVESCLANAKKELADADDYSMSKTMLKDLVEKLESDLSGLTEPKSGGGDNHGGGLKPRIPFNKWSRDIKKKFKVKFDQTVEDYGYDIVHTFDMLHPDFPDLTYEELTRKIMREKAKLEKGGGRKA